MNHQNIWERIMSNKKLFLSKNILTLFPWQQSILNVFFFQKWDIFQKTLQNVNVSSLTTMPHVIFQAARYYALKQNDLTNCVSTLDILKKFVFWCICVVYFVSKCYFFKFKIKLNPSFLCLKIWVLIFRSWTHFVRLSLKTVMLR